MNQWNRDSYSRLAWMGAGLVGILAWGCDDAPEKSSSPPADTTGATDAASVDARGRDLRSEPTPDILPPTDSRNEPTSDVPPRRNDGSAKDASSGDASRDTLERCPRSLESMFSEEHIDSPDRASDGYVPPTADRRSALRASITSVTDGRKRDGKEHARRARYRVCRVEIDGATIAVWRPESLTRGRSRWAVRLGGTPAPLVIEAPHPFYDLETRVEALQIFERAEARALLVSGTHRCANTDASTCSGETGTCTDGDDRVPYRTSDMAHNVETGFQTAHAALTDRFASTVAVSVHGFTLEGISLSDGTRDPTESSAPVARLAGALERHLPNVRVTSCNDYPGADHRERFCGTTNVQGRQLNGVSGACSDFAVEASDRFLHLEQTRSIRENKRDRVAAAFAEVFANP